MHQMTNSRGGGIDILDILRWFRIIIRKIDPKLKFLSLDPTDHKEIYEHVLDNQEYLKNLLPPSPPQVKT